MKFFRKIDIISPRITLYYKGQLLHSSIFSGILSLIYYILMVSFGVYYLHGFFRKENPTAFFFKRYVEDAGNFPLNSSSMFNFVQLNQGYVVDIDFDSLRIIGLERTIDMYIADSDLRNYDHWIYGKCNNDTDTKDIGYLINSNDYFKSACIRKYYNKTVGKYYETNDINFRWPSLDRGCSNSDATYYGIIIEKCKNDSLRINFDKKFCKSDSEINEYMTHVSVKLQLLDYSADVLNYNEPFTKYIYEISNVLFGESYTINHLNFNPAIAKTHTGLIFDRIDEKYVYFFQENEKVTASIGDTGIYVAFYFWMQNIMQYYERKYQLLQDALSNVGGITRTILSAANVINYISSYYVTLLDSEELFTSQNAKNCKGGIKNKKIFINKIKKNEDNSNSHKKFQFHNNYKYRKNNTLSNTNFLNKDNVNYSRLSREVFGINSNRNIAERNESSEQNKYLFYNKSNYFGENNDFCREKKERNNKSEIEQMNFSNSLNHNNLKKETENNEKYIKAKYKIIHINDKFNRNEFNFFKFISYFICCSRNNQKMNFIKELRYKILSEETIVQNYLNLKEVNKLSEIIK